MPGLLDLLQSQNLGGMAQSYEGMTPEVMRAELAKQLAAQGQQVDLTNMQPAQMMFLLRALRKPVATGGIRG